MLVHEHGQHLRVVDLNSVDCSDAIFQPTTTTIPAKVWMAGFDSCRVGHENDTRILVAMVGESWVGVWNLDKGLDKPQIVYENEHATRPSVFIQSVVMRSPQSILLPAGR